MANKQLTIVANTPSKNTKLLVQHYVLGAQKSGAEINIREIPPLECTLEDIFKTDGLILGTTENLSYMSGLIKDFFDRMYYPCLDNKQGMPIYAYVRAGYDGTGTINALEKIVTGLKWKWAQPIQCYRGDWQESWLKIAEEKGAWMALSLEMGMI